MPGVPANAGARILERLVLQAGLWQAYRASVIKEALAVGRHEVRHLAPLPHVTVEPEPSVHRVDHPLATLRELDGVYGAWWSIHSAPCALWLLTDDDALGRRRRKRRIAGVDVAADRVSHVVLRLRVPSLTGHDGDGERHTV